MSGPINWYKTEVLDRALPIVLVRIQIPGTSSQPLDVSDQVLDLVYEDEESKADKCSLTVDNFNLSNFDQPVWQKGRVLEVSWGYPGNISPAREVVIQKITGFQKLKVEGYSKAILMHKVRKNRVFEGISRSAAIQQLAEENGFTGDLLQIEDTQDVLPTITQARETDAEFIRRMAKQEGFEFYVDFDGFHFHPRQLGQKPLRVYHYYTDPGRGDVSNFNVNNDITGVPGKVSVKGRNPKTKESVAANGSNTETQHDGVAPQKEVGSTEDQLFDNEENTDADYQSSTTVTPKVDSGVVAETTVPLKNAQDATTAKKQADGHYRKAVLKTVEISLSVRGDPSLLAKTVFEMRGVGKRLSGNYYLNSVSHKVSAGNYSCELKAKSDGHSGYASSASGKGALSVPRLDSKAQVNPQTGDNADPDLLEQRGTYDKEGLGSELTFVDKRGRPTAGALGKLGNLVKPE